MSVQDEQGNSHRLAKDIGSLYYSDLLPLAGDSEPETREFLNRMTEILMDFLHKTFDRSSKILDFHHPEQLLEIIDLSLPNQPKNIDQLLADCRDTLTYQVKTGHPRFFNQLSNGVDVISMAGEWLTATANTNMFTYEISPVFILMEHMTLKKMREIIGYKGGDSILAPGGTVSNLYAVLAARYRKYPRVKSEGLQSLPGPLVMFTSEHSHFSMMSAAAASGLGTDNCISVPCNEKGQMIPAELERLVLKSISDGKIPFMVTATAGTTVFGAFDPINPIADICDKHHLWLHIDAAWGGGLLMSEKFRYKFEGIQRADSVTWNPHKMMNVLLQCSTVHFKQNSLLYHCNRMCADYLFQQDKHYDVTYDTGDKVIQCGRHNDIFKFWLLWRAKGTEGFAKQMERFVQLTQYLVEGLLKRPERFQLIVAEPECTNVCFWYVPTRFRTMAPGPERDRLLGQITPILKGRMMSTGTLMVGYQPQGKLPNFFRCIISNQAVTEEDVDFLVDEMDRLGHDL
ncbi:glutamate decarboxylase isoform X2 [Daphnia magna]|uniref:glutamate decarboxylase isoform X2 n=1 Tax=Daphnia magna TaxID=35525 RepID=UPI001E1BCBF6|nr:glutamate decarboxylase isoform X2 [Daphnia magna]